MGKERGVIVAGVVLGLVIAYFLMVLITWTLLSLLAWSGLWVGATAISAWAAAIPLWLLIILFKGGK